MEIRVIQVSKPKYYGNSIIENETELHLFADAACQAYGAVAYLRTITQEVVNVSFIIGNCRFVPMRTKGISRSKLEPQILSDSY